MSQGLPAPAGRHEILKGLTIEGYADLQDRAGDARWSTWQVFGAFVRRPAAWAPRYRATPAIGVWQRGDPQPRVRLRRTEVRDRLFVFARADHNFDPVPDGETIDYLPMSDRVGNTLWIGGVDIELDRHVFFQPHVEIVDYSTPTTGPALQTDVMVKATVFVTWYDSAISGGPPAAQR